MISRFVVSFTIPSTDQILFYPGQRAFAKERTSNFVRFLSWKTYAISLTSIRTNWFYSRLNDIFRYVNQDHYITFVAQLRDSLKNEKYEKGQA